jgi:peptidoglycan/xylan/chitin deacetylase (PgdA/CDA1 family)
VLNVFTSLRSLRRRVTSTTAGLALLYHRVTELPLDPQLLCVSPTHFGEHLDVLTNAFQPLSLLEFIERLRRGRLPSRAVVVTFDDGYEDNLSRAKPILSRYGVPATVFVTTGYMGGDREFWWDELERLLLQPGPLPDVIRLKIAGVAYEWELRDATRYTSEECHRHARWNVSQRDNTPTSRHEVYRSLCELLRPLSHAERRPLLDQLTAASRFDCAARATHRILSPRQVKDLAAGGLVTVGAHTVTHPQLSALPLDRQREEIDLSKRHLESVLDQPVTTFAYPYGSQLDYSGQTVAAVREAGFAAACSNFPARMTRRTDPFQVPRVIIRDCDGGAFARQLSDAVNG